VPSGWPTIRFTTWRLWDSYVAWVNLEPEKGKWDFSVLDKYVAMSEQHNVRILLTLAMSPSWATSDPTGANHGEDAPPKNLSDWQDYVRTVGTRYKGRIHDYEIWNEPNLKEFYTGSVPQLVDLDRVAYTTLKEIDPTITVSSPPFTGAAGVDWLDRFLNGGGKNYADAIGYHFYVNPGPPELMFPLIQKVKAVMEKDGVATKPLWNTESGWAIQDTRSVIAPAPGGGFNGIVLSEEQASAYLARSYILAWASGISRFYWYAWDNKVMGLTEEDGKTPKPPAEAYSQMENWLTGARMTSCGSDEASTWTCEITRANDYHGYLVWNPTHSLAFHIPANWRVREAHSLTGPVQKVADGQTIQITESPILLGTAGK
jgi:hypothetical protein